MHSRDGRMMHDLFRDKSIFLIRPNVFVGLVLQTCKRSNQEDFYQ